MAEDRRVSLGCGTLILIALIVLIFSNQDRSGQNVAIETELRALETQVSELRQAIERQTQQISSLEREIQSKP